MIGFNCLFLHCVLWLWNYLCIKFQGCAIKTDCARASLSLRHFTQTCLSCISLNSLWIQLKTNALTQFRISACLLWYVCNYACIWVILHQSHIKTVWCFDATFDPTLTHLMGTPHTCICPQSASKGSIKESSWRYDSPQMAGYKGRPSSALWMHPSTT